MDFTPDTLVTLERGFSTAFDKGLFNDKVPQFYPDKAEIIETPGIETNVYGWMAEMPQFREWIGERQVKRLAARSYILKNTDKEFSYAVSRNDIKYDRLGIYKTHFSKAGNAGRVVWDQYLAAAQKAGKTVKCYDGQFFYDTDHPENVDNPSGSQFINLYTTKPLTAANVFAGAAAMASIKDANGEPMMVQPNVIECNSKLKLKCLDAIKASLTTKVIQNVLATENVAGTAVDNMLRMAFDLTPIFNDRIEDGVWYLHDTRVFKPFVVQIETPPTGLEMRVNPEDPHVWDNNEFLFGSRCTGTVGYTLPQLSARFEEA